MVGAQESAGDKGKMGEGKRRKGDVGRERAQGAAGKGKRGTAHEKQMEGDKGQVGEAGRGKRASGEEQGWRGNRNRDRKREKQGGEETKAKWIGLDECEDHESAQKTEDKEEERRRATRGEKESGGVDEQRINGANGKQVGASEKGGGETEGLGD